MVYSSSNIWKYEEPAPLERKISEESGFGSESSEEQQSDCNSTDKYAETNPSSDCEIASDMGWVEHLFFNVSRF